MKKILVTGALGFIGSHFVKYLLSSDVLNQKIVNTVIGLARNSDQWALNRLEDYRFHKNFRLVYVDLATGDISGILEGVDIVVNCAAKTFVDHSIKDPEPFISS